MKILFYGDSITDMRHQQDAFGNIFSYGDGYVFFATGDLLKDDPTKHEILNCGISGNRIVDLYARVKRDVWNHKPDVLSILIGVNDVWHDQGDNPNGVCLARWEKMYRLLLDDTLERLPNVKLMIMEPFVLHGSATDGNFEHFLKVKNYAKVAKKIAEDYGACFVPLQEKFDVAAAKFAPHYYLYDGVHPAIAGAKLIADEWVAKFKQEIDK